MTESDTIIVNKEILKITQQWTPEMIDSLLSHLGFYLLDKDLTQSEYNNTPPWDVSDKL